MNFLSRKCYNVNTKAPIFGTAKDPMMGLIAGRKL